MPGITAKRPQLEGIQVLRALGLFVVIQAHVAMTVITNTYGTEEYPAMISRIFTTAGKGVLDVFFVISGFIMVYISREAFGRKGAARDFLVMRLTRVVPVYWIYTLAAIILPLVAGWIWGFNPVNVTEAIKSFLFIPFLNEQLPSLYAGGGALYPALVVGWTLNVEMLFYVMFTVCLFFSLRTALIGLTLVMFMMAAVHPFIPYQMPALFFWTMPIMWKFLFGCWLGYAWIKDIRWEASRHTVMLSMLAAFVGHCFFYMAYIGGLDDVWFQTITGLLAAIIVAGVTISDYEHTPAPKLLVRIGDASYSGYLCHMFVIVIVFAICEPLMDLELTGRIILGIITFILSLVWAHGSYRLLELPLISSFRNRFGKASHD